MKKRYVLTVRVTIEAMDDVQARAQALALRRICDTMFWRIAPQTGEIERAYKLQHCYPDRKPRIVTIL